MYHSNALKVSQIASLAREALGVKQFKVSCLVNGKPLNSIKDTFIEAVHLLARLRQKNKVTEVIIAEV